MKLVDQVGLYTALDAKRVAEGLFWSDVAILTMQSKSTFSRLGSGRGLSLEGYAACCGWLGAPMDTFLAPAAGDPVAQRDPAPDRLWARPGSVVVYGDRRELGTVLGLCGCSECPPGRGACVVLLLAESGRRLRHVPLGALGPVLVWGSASGDD